MRNRAERIVGNLSRKGQKPFKQSFSCEKKEREGERTSVSYPVFNTEKEVFPFDFCFIHLIFFVFDSSVSLLPSLFYSVALPISHSELKLDSNSLLLSQRLNFCSVIPCLFCMGMYMFIRTGALSRCSYKEGTGDECFVSVRRNTLAQARAS